MTDQPLTAGEMATALRTLARAMAGVTSALETYEQATTPSGSPLFIHTCGTVRAGGRVSMAPPTRCGGCWDGYDQMEEWRALYVRNEQATSPLLEGAPNEG